MISEDKSKLIKARLILAQQLLEEADVLPGLEGYNFSNPDSNSGDPFFHMRHEREALVVYLLLTCFDLLGQSQPHVSLMKWLTSNDSAIVKEREIAAAGIESENSDCVAQAKDLIDYYNRHHGATVAFYAGIDQLHESARTHLLSTVDVAKEDPDARKPENIDKNISYCRIPLNNDANVLKLQKKYLYTKRNEFTHQLSQTHFSSVPMMSGFGRDPDSNNILTESGASWAIFVYDGKVHYGGVNQEIRDKFVYTLSDWPFVLFEVLYSALGEEFDRTSIKLKFFIQVMNSGEDFVVNYPSVEHEKVSELLLREHGVTIS
ncbi:Uncharacterised protein [Enterobacter hormaechei]|uniref:hypothetical protein n=1 Tax=Enterobacter hormaechei TaxID=158836 RepID=UPI00079AD463|nr:hypothetical protein [Enterobacter hormaechei]SAE41789.1 Uncharacterised protein [Enterobacter hormaechei]